jgi:hypothetical protein
MTKEITFGEFRKQMLRRGRTVDDLVRIFRRKLDDSRSFFERVMSCQWRNPATKRIEDRSGVVIQYKCVIDFYLKENGYLEDSKVWRKKVRQAKRPERDYNAADWARKLCACGCGHPVFDRREWATDACRKRASRNQSQTAKSVRSGPNEIEQLQP